MTRNTASAPGYWVGNRALIFDLDSDPEPEKLVRTRNHQGENTSQITQLKSIKRMR